MRNTKKRESFELAAQAGAAHEVISRYGSASKEHLVSYSGVDNEYGKSLKRGLKKTASSRLSRDYVRQNLKQQAGFAAEDKYSARQNAENIISGIGKRYIRTDDIGRVNDKLHDHVILNENGIEIIGSGEQMKFVGATPKECLSKIASKGFKKYIDSESKIVVPNDFYEDILYEADAKIISLQKQLDSATKRGKYELIEKLNLRISKYKKIKTLLKDSGISNKEALEARVSPKLSVAKDIARISDKAGIEQAKIGTMIGGGMSLIKNAVEVIKGEKDAIEAANSIIVDSAKSGLAAYATAFAGSAVKASMQNAKNEFVRAVSKTNIPAMIVTSSIDLGKSMTRFVKGEISGVELLEEIGERGVGHLCGAMFTLVGQTIIPIPVVGAMVGSMVGYTLTSSFYNELVSSLNEAGMARENRIRIEKECEEAVNCIQQYRYEMNRIVSEYLADYNKTFNDAFSEMDAAFLAEDINQFISGANKITKKMGGETQFETMEEFDAFMENEEITLTL